jgi:hypothetical protein
MYLSAQIELHVTLSFDLFIFAAVMYLASSVLGRCLYEYPA